MPGEDFLVARDGEEMIRRMRAILKEPDLASAVAMHGRRTVLSRHTCAHRVDELLKIVREVEAERRAPKKPPRKMDAKRRSKQAAMQR